MPASTAVTVTALDQSALRALLGLVWDTGDRLLSLDIEPDPGFPLTEGEAE